MRNSLVRQPSLIAPKSFAPAQTAGPLAALLCVAFLPALQATVLDNFNGPKTGWTDTLNSGTINQSAGQFTIATANNSGALTYSEKTSVAFSAAAGHTLEFRVDVNTVSPGNRDTNALTILSWVPLGGAVLANGYSLVAGAGGITIQKGATLLYATNYTDAGASIQNTNTTLVLRMTPSGGAMNVNARVYRRVADGQIGQYFTTIFEYTAVDPAGSPGQDGNVALGVKNQASPAGCSVAFANLQVFDITNTLLDDFNSGLGAWTIFKKNPGQGDSVTESGGQVDVLATIADASGGFAGLYSANQTFKITDGSRLEFQLDMVNNIGGENSYSALSYLPVASTAYIYGIISYHVAHDQTGHTIVLSGKGYNEWWAGRNDIQPPTTPPGCRYIITMTGEGANCRVESRIEDLSVPDVNDPAHIVFQTEFVDTPAADPGLGEDSVGNLAPYLNLDGRFLITTFNSGAFPPTWADCVFDNAVVNQTVPANAAPAFQNVTPTFGANFLADTTAISFDVADETNVPLNNIMVTLNGVQYTSGSPAVTITPGGDVAASRHFSLAGALVPNRNYIGSIQATDPFGLASTASLVFDTFLTNDYLIESEEYNFSNDGGVTGGHFIDSPILIAEGSSDPNAYNSQPGLADVDFHDNQAPWAGGADNNHTFRSVDSVYTSHCADPARAKYVSAGGIAAGFYEEEVEDIFEGDWLNYTHHYPAGTFNVFLRQATFKLLNSLVTLERVTSDPAQPSQSTALLGSFSAAPSGLGLFVNVPLTDGPGNPVVLRFSGSLDTLRVMNRVTGNANLDNGNLEQNYLVFVPVPDPGTLRPLVASVSPLPDSTLNSPFPVITATIVNRETSLDSSSIGLQINGAAVTASVTSTASGADVSYALSPLPLPGSIVTNALIFRDNTGAYQTNTWSWRLTYTLLRASNSLPLGSLNVRGFDARMVQTDNGGVTLDNSLLRAEQQLAIPPIVQPDLTATSIVQVLDWDKASDPPANVPGLCPGPFNNIAVESLAYLELSAGVHRFRIDTDDRSGVYSGARLNDPNRTIVFESSGNTFNGTFDFVAEAAGLYPFRCVWEETGGGAHLHVRSVNLSDNSELLLNDPANPNGVVRAWYPLACLSAASIAGSFSVDANAVNVPALTDVICSETQQPINQMVTGGTLTIPESGATRFYRLNGPRSTRITNISRSGSNIVLTYQVN